MTEQNMLNQLDSFDDTQRLDALKNLKNLIDTDGENAPAGENVNMHLHSFYSFNAEDYSPSHLALRAKQTGLFAAGLCDFDVLDGLEEFIRAGELLCLRTTVNIETRGFLKEFQHVDITSPGEPGVTYIMGAGFTHLPQNDTPQAATLDTYATQAKQRNLDLIERINSHLGQIAINYDQHVESLTPSGTATERHIIQAYINRAAEKFTDASLPEFLAGILGCAQADVPADQAKLADLMRAKLAKRGGVGYSKPSEGTFPAVKDFFAWVASCDAIPMITWLDGTSEGESIPESLLSCQQALGAAAINIVPERNWNITDPAQRQIKQQKLDEIIKLAQKMQLPINIGTEMNKIGLPFVDDLAGPVLKRHAQAFIDGAKIMVGQGVLSRYAGLSYVSSDIANICNDIATKNTFFASVGALPPISQAVAGNLYQMGKTKAFATISDAVKKGDWS